MQQREGSVQQRRGRSVQQREDAECSKGRAAAAGRPQHRAAVAKPPHGPEEQIDRNKETGKWR